MEYRQLAEINKNLQAIDVKGKPYVEVNKRVLAFRSIEPNGSIETEIVSNQDGICTIKATVKNSEGRVLATGFAYEKESSTFINKTSYIENCETSAVGRALGFLGIGIESSIASAEEVANAIHKQAGAKSLNTMTKDEHGRALIILKKMREAQHGLD